MRIMIYGYGFVGKAHAHALKSKHIVYIRDIAKGFDNLNRPEAAIIAVSTPIGKDGSCDMSNVYDCIKQIASSTPILIKSTISLEGWREIKTRWPEKTISFSPEYLRAARAQDDFKNQDEIQIGGGDESFWINLLGTVLPLVRFDIAEAEELILAKYIRNSFLALKVAFFNQAYDLCEKAGVEHTAVSHYVSMDDRIGDGHTYVTEERGFGGHCFPKDTSALVASAKVLGYDFSILKEAIEYNDRIRTK